MNNPKSQSRGRLYKGMDATDRQRHRRELLIEAGIDLFGTRGYRSTSVKMVCDASNLTERYFYESFSNREGLLIAVYESLEARLEQQLQLIVENDALTPPERLRAVIGTFYDFIFEDKRRAKIMLFEILGIDSRLDENYQNVVRNQAALLMHPAVGLFSGNSSGAVSDESSHVMSIGLVGAVTQVGIQWALEDFKTPREIVIDSVVSICYAVAEIERAAG